MILSIRFSHSVHAKPALLHRFNSWRAHKVCKVQDPAGQICDCENKRNAHVSFQTSIPMVDTIFSLTHSVQGCELGPL